MSHIRIPSMAILVVAGLALSCSDGCFVDADDVWCREISDNELHVCGVEEIVFGSGSSVEIINALCLNYSDSTLLCELTFSTSIKGRWVVEGDSLKIYLDSSSYCCDTIPGGFMMEVEEQRHDVPQLRGDLFRELTEYYSGVYADIESDGPLEVSGVTVSKEGIVSGINNGHILFWRKSRLQDI